MQLKNKEPARLTRTMDKIQSKSIKCKYCAKGTMTNDPNNTHHEALGMVGRKGFKIIERLNRQFKNYYFCNQCVRVEYKITED